MATKTYDPKQILISFNGFPLSGLADTFVKVSRDEDAYMKKVGADGEPARARNRNKGGSVSVTLMSSSLSNDALSAAYALDDLLGTGQGTLFIKDALGTTLVHAESAWIKKIPDIELGKEIGEREWTFDTGDLSIFVGGNF